MIVVAAVVLVVVALLLLTSNSFRRFQGADRTKTNMAIISVKMVSGWEADPASLKSLLKEKRIARYDIDPNGAVQIYLDKVKQNVWFLGSKCAETGIHF